MPFVRHSQRTLIPVLLAGLATLAAAAGQAPDFPSLAGIRLVRTLSPASSGFIQLGLHGAPGRSVTLGGEADAVLLDAETATGASLQIAQQALAEGKAVIVDSSAAPDARRAVQRTLTALTGHGVEAAGAVVQQRSVEGRVHWMITPIDAAARGQRRAGNRAADVFSF